MANRPVFYTLMEPPFFQQIMVDFTFYSGFSKVQKQKSINSLHQTFLKEHPNKHMLEISSKSNLECGVKLSAFNLLIECKDEKKYSVEVAFQSSKVFENGGPYTELLYKSSKEAKRDPRLKSSGPLKYFYYSNRKFNLTPKTYFYNWLYINTLHLHKDLAKKIIEFDSFTDIEFNPNKSINCQAKAAAVYVSLNKQRMLEEALQNKDSFLEIVYGNNYTEPVQLNIWD